MKFKLFLLAILIASATPSVFSEVTEIDDIWDIQYNHRPMVVEAYASWCAPCKVYGPIVERLSMEYDGKVDFYKVNVDNPDAADFIDRYEINSVPTTVFLWDPEGDATVKHSVERGLIGYDELKYYIEKTLQKQYKRKSQSAYSVPSALSWSSGISSEGLMSYTDFISEMVPFVGEWIGEDYGFESKLWFFREGQEFQGVGGTLNPERFSLVNSVYWLALSFGWDEERNMLYITDVLPSEPSSLFNHVNNGTYRERYFTPVNGNLEMKVEEYYVRNGSLSETPVRRYTATYHRVN